MARFFRRGVSKVLFLPAVAGTSPTRGEINAGTDLTAAITDIAGWQLNNTPISYPTLNTDFDQQITGVDATADSSLTFVDEDNSNTIRNALAKGTAGYIVLMPYGDVATKRCEVWQVRTTGVNDQWVLTPDVARFVVGFAILTRPTQAGTIPA